MKVIIQMLKQHQVYILGVLVVFFFMRSCSRGSHLRYAREDYAVCQVVSDSLEKRILILEDSISYMSAICERRVFDREKAKELQVHLYYDDKFDELDRGPQMMNFHINVIKPNINRLKKDL